MGTARVRAVVAKKRGQGDAAPLGVFEIEFRLGRDAAGMRALSRKGSGLEVPPALEAHASGKIVVGDLGHRLQANPAYGSHYPDRNENGRGQSPARPHQRTRLSPVRVKSLSFRLFWN